MSAFLDATCPKCRKRFGWTGKITDRPKCPKCGYRPPDSELEEAEKEMEEFERMILEKSKNKKGGK